MLFKFNIIDDIYELIRQAQLKKNHYKRINDVKSRKRSSAVTNIRRIDNMKFNHYCFSNSLTTNTTLRTFNLDSIKEKFMKTNKCFNYNESSHLNRDCSKFKKFKVAEMNVKNDIKNSKKK